MAKLGKGVAVRIERAKGSISAVDTTWFKSYELRVLDGTQ